MDTPLVKILLIAAAIAITVGVTVLAWSIFNTSSAEVETDQDQEAISNTPGTRADGVRARIDNARACEALGSAHWIDKGTNTDSGKVKDTWATGDGADNDTKKTITDHPATRTDEGDSHCAAGADVRSDSEGHVRKLWLHTDQWRLWTLK